MIQIAHGNLLRAPVEALVNTVNTEGVMGKGIALQFRVAYPRMFDAYLAACRAGEVRLGRMHVFDLGGLADGPRWIINFPTKGHWRAKSRIEDIEAGLRDLVATIRRLQIKSIAIPPLGCGNGGLPWDQVRSLIANALSEVPDVAVQLFAPEGAPKAPEMPNRTARPDMTAGRAVLITLMDRYLNAILDPLVTLLEVHKLMYFMQEAGQELRLQYKAGKYGPYATNLRQVLIKLEGHMLQGYGDGDDKPGKPLDLLPGAVDEAQEFLVGQVDVLDRMQRVGNLIDGFEDAYGMELLSSVHWAMTHSSDAKNDPNAAIAVVHGWNDRKRKLLKPDHLRSAWERLKRDEWDVESRSALRQ
jgi:O-acetyl-ADP-ribose deacetylase (regulator of RNase III)